MKYSIGKIVVLVSGITVYITEYNEKTKQYKGINAEENNPQKEISFSEKEVIMTI